MLRLRVLPMAALSAVALGQPPPSPPQALATLGGEADLDDPTVIRCMHTEPADGFFRLIDESDYDRVFNASTPTQYDAVEVTDLVTGFLVETVLKLANATNYTVRLYQLNGWYASLTASSNALARLWSVVDGELSQFDCDVNSELMSPSSYQYVEFIAPVVPYGMIVVGPVASLKKITLIDSLFRWTAPFTPGVWLLLGAHIFIGGIGLAWFEGRSMRRMTCAHCFQATYESISIFNGVGAFEPSSLGGKVWSMFYSFVVLLVVASYTANLTSFLVSEGRPVQVVTGIHSFCDKGVPACVGATSHQDWVATHYPCVNTTLIDKSLGYSGLIDAAREGTQCKGVISTDVHMKYTMHIERTCDMELLGQGLNTAYYALAFRRDPGLAEVVAAFDAQLVTFFSDGTMTDVITTYFPPDPISANDCDTEDDEDEETISLGLTEMGGTFALAVIGTLIALIAHYATTNHAQRSAAREASKEPEPALVGLAARTPDAALSDTVERILQGQIELRRLLEEAKTAAPAVQGDRQCDGSSCAGSLPVVPVVASEAHVEPVPVKRRRSKHHQCAPAPAPRSSGLSSKLGIPRVGNEQK